MFEQEAENYASKNSGVPSLPIHEAYARGLEEGFQDGAEFGYNLCFQQIRKLVNEDTRLDCIIPELLRLQEIEQ